MRLFHKIFIGAFAAAFFIQPVLSQSPAPAVPSAPAPAVSTAPPAQSNFETKVTFIVMNDIYLMNDQAGQDGQMRGGFARLAAVVKAERAKGGHVLLVHGGDTFSPSLMSSLDQGAHIVTLTNMLAPDVFAPGNHEFDGGKENFLKLLSQSKFPYYAANMRAGDGAPLYLIKDRSIATFDGVRIGLTGAAYDQSPQVSSPGDMKFAPTVDTVKAQSALLRKEGADFVAAVMHAQRGDSLVLQSSRAAELLLTGHSHDMYVSFEEGTAIVESSYDAHYVTAVDVAIKVAEKDGKRTMRWWPQFRIIDTATVEPDPEVAAQVAKFQEQLNSMLQISIGSTAVELDSRSAILRSGEAAMGNLIADGLRALTKADAAVMNGGGIRAGKIYPVNSIITRKDILAEMPFGNRIVEIEISGKDLKTALEHGLSLLPEPAGRFPQVSGIVFSYDISRPAGQRIVTMSVAGQPLDEAKLYRVATNDFMAKGGDGYERFAKARLLTQDADDAPLVATGVMDYVKTLGVVQTGIEGRSIKK